MENFNIVYYLKNYDKSTKKGSCKACSVKVQRVRERVAGHKKGSCKNSTPEDKNSKIKHFGTSLVDLSLYSLPLKKLFGE